MLLHSSLTDLQSLTQHKHTPYPVIYFTPPQAYRGEAICFIAQTIIHIWVFFHPAITTVTCQELSS